MVRRVHLLPSNRLLGAALCLLFSGVSLSAQSTPFVVAPSLSLTAVPTSVAAGDLNGDGKLDLVITKKASGNVTVLLGNGNGGFSTGVDYAAAKLAGNVVLADLNGDGRLDVAVTDTASGAIDVLFGNGDGTLRAPVTYAAQSNPLALALGNFTGRGKIDLAVASANGLSILLNDGGGNFTAAASVPLSGSPQSLTASDLRGTGRDDLALANQNGTVTVLLGNGSGSFNAQPALSVGAGSLSAVVASDFNGDGKPDLAVSAASSNAVAVLLGHGDGSFAPAVAYTVGNSPASLVAADLRSNGITDLVSVNQAANTFSVLLGNGDGTFGPSSDFVAGNSPIALAAADFNGDGHADLAIVNSGSSTIAVPLGRGDGTFVASRAYRADLERKAIASGDLNGDGHSDLVVTNFCGGDPSCASAGTATVFLAQLDGTYKAASTITLGNGPVGVALADLNGDKKLDLLAINQTDKSLMVMLGNGDGTFGAPQLYTLSASPRALYVADFNGDGKPDLAIASDCGQATCSQPGSVDIWLGHGDGSLAASASYTVGYSPISIAAGDLRGTGHPDLIVANACGDTSACTGDGTGSLLANDGTGKFTQMGEVDLGPSPSSIALGNLSGNGLDLAVAQRTSNQVAVLHANGSGGFGAPVTYSVGTAPSALTIADFNGDGNQDVAVANFQSSTVSVLYGTGSGTLGSTTTYPVSSGPDALVAVAPISGHISSLVTTNGDTGATPMGNGITALGGFGGTTPSTTTFTSSATPSTVDTAVAISGNVAPTTTPGPATPTGNLVFAIDASGTGAGPFTYLADCGGAAGKALDTNGNATCTTQLLPAGTNNIQLQYFGDLNYATSVSAADQAQTISAAGTTTTVSATTAAPLGQSVTLTATVAPTSTIATTASDALAFSGTVSFFANGSPTAITGCDHVSVTNMATTENATANCATSSLPFGSNSITAQYNTGDPNYSTSTSGSVTQTITQASTTTSVTSVSPSSLNGSVTFTATVNVPSGAPAPTGTITFTDNGNTTAFCTQTLPAVTCSTSSLSAGTHTIVAAYSGDTNYLSSNGSATQSVTASTSTIGVTSSPSSSTVNQSVAFTATVTRGSTGIALSGTVSLTDGVSGPPVPGCTISFNTGTGVATCSTSSLSKGTHTIVATYSGDSNYVFQTGGNTVAQTVNTGTATIALTSTSNPATATALPTFNAAVTPNNSGIAALTGTVNFTDSVTGNTIPNCGTVGVVSGVATCTPSSLSVGTHTITAAYNNDSNFTFVSGGNTVSQVINASGTSMSLATSANPASVDQTPVVTFTATISVTGGTGTPTYSGTVAFTDTSTSTTLCSGVHPSTSGVASCPAPGLTAAASPHTITAAYTGDVSLGNANATLTPSQTVTKGTTTLGVISSQPSAAINASVTFTATLTFPSGSVPLTGAVAFTDSATSAAIPGCAAQTVAAVTGVATCTTSSLSLGTHTITGTYTDSANNFSTSANSVMQTVGSATISMTLATSSNAATVNQSPSITFTSTITAPSGGTSLSGTVGFTDNGAAIPGCTAVHPSAGGVANCIDGALTAAGSPHTIAAAYTGDTNFGTASAQLTPTETVSKATTSLALVTSQSISAINASVTFTATLTFPSGSVPLTGSVGFTDSVTGTSIPGCSAQAVNASTGVTTCTTSTLSLGAHTITATYTDGAGNFLTSANAVTQTVSSAAISMSMAATGTSGTVNQAPALIFDANITAPAGTTTLTGVVEFTDNGAPIAGCTAVPPAANGSGWTAACPDSALTAAGSPHTIAASYSGDKNFGTANATLAAPVAISAAVTTTAITASPNPSSFNQPVTFTATVSAPAGGVALSGKVSFTDSATTAAIPGCAAVTPLANGVATCSYSGLAIGTHTVTAAYGGDVNFNASSNTITQGVGVTATTTTLIANPPSATFNIPVTFTATVSSAAQGSTAFSGTMDFTDNGATIPGCGAVAVNAVSGIAICTTSTLPAGADTIIAAYSNDKNFGGSTASLTEQVAAATATISLAPTTPAPILAVNPKGTNDSVTFTAAIFPAYSGSVPLSGMMVFTDTITSNGTTSSAPICKAPPTASGVAVCTCPSASCALPSGQNTITASYTGDPNLTPAPSAAVSQLVEDYSLVVSSAPPVAVTQGFTTSNDLFSSQTISVAPVSISGFTTASGQPLALTCAVTAIAPATGATAPLCTLGGSTLVVAASGTPEPTDSIVIDATKATAGTYSVTLNATDPTTGLAHSSSSFNVVVRGVDGPLTLVSGATTGNTASVSFLLPAGVSLSNIACSFAAGPNLSSMVAPSSLSIGCSFSPTTIPASGSQQNGSTTIAVTTGSTTSSLAGHGSLLFAGVIGIPLFGLFGLLRGRRSLGATLLRLLAIAMIGAAAFQAMGCGGSFQRSTATGGGQTPPGAYDLLITGKGSDGNTYQAVLSLNVTL